MTINLLRTAFPYLWLVTFLAARMPAWAQGAYAKSGREVPIVIDLSGSRTWEEVTASGIKCVELKGFTDMKAYHLPAEYVAWKLPGGMIIQHHMTHGALDFKDGYLRSVRSYGEMMPLEEVMILARKLHVLLGQDTHDLEKWAVTEGVKGMDGLNFTFGSRDCNPVMDCAVRHSFGAVFPWVIDVAFGWPPEANMKKPLPHPFKTGGVLNLDPPSGKRYTPEEDFRLYQKKHGYPDSILRTYGWLWPGGALFIMVLLTFLRKRRAVRSSR